MVGWLTTHRTTDDAARLLAALGRMRATFGRFPGIGEAVVAQTRTARRGASRSGSAMSVRVLRLGRLPYLVWYGFDPELTIGPVWLLALMHEKQDRARFGPTLFDR